MCIMCQESKIIIGKICQCKSFLNPLQNCFWIRELWGLFVNYLLMNTKTPMWFCCFSQLFLADLTVYTVHTIKWRILFERDNYIHVFSNRYNEDVLNVQILLQISILGFAKSYSCHIATTTLQHLTFVFGRKENFILHFRRDLGKSIRLSI